MSHDPKIGIPSHTGQRVSGVPIGRLDNGDRILPSLDALFHVTNARRRDPNVQVSFNAPVVQHVRHLEELQRSLGILRFQPEERIVVGLKPRVEAERARTLELSGLTARARDPVCQFSGGMKRRLNLACGVIHEPDVVLLDEPTVGVDPQSREHIYEAMAGFAEEGTALLLTTHYMQEAERLCGRVAIMDEGKFIAEGTVDELVDRAALEHTVELDLVRPATEKLRQKLESLGGVSRPLGGYFFTGKSSSQSLPAILAMVVAEGNDVHKLNVHRPDLGDVFLHLTGKALRD